MTLTMASEKGGKGCQPVAWILVSRCCSGYTNVRTTAPIVNCQPERGMEQQVEGSVVQELRDGTCDTVALPSRRHVHPKP